MTCETVRKVSNFYLSLNEFILMRLLLLAMLLVAPWVAINAADNAKSDPVVKKTLRAGEPTEADLSRARLVLSTWENEEQQKSPRVMRIVYWSPADREPPASLIRVRE